MTTQHAVERIDAELENRFKLLLCHGILASTGGLLMLLFGTSQIYEDLVGPWSRLILGALALVAGLLVVTGLIVDRFAWWVIAAGMVGLTAWYVAMTLGFAGTVIVDPPQLSWPWSPAPEIPPTRPYIAVVYGGLSMSGIIHLHTIRRVRRG